MKTRKGCLFDRGRALQNPEQTEPAHADMKLCWSDVFLDASPYFTCTLMFFCCNMKPDQIAWMRMPHAYMVLCWLQVFSWTPVHISLRFFFSAVKPWLDCRDAHAHAHMKLCWSDVFLDASPYSLRCFCLLQKKKTDQTAQMRMHMIIWNFAGQVFPWTPVHISLTFFFLLQNHRPDCAAGVHAHTHMKLCW